MSGIRIDYKADVLTKSVNQHDTGKVYTKNSTVNYVYSTSKPALIKWRWIFRNEADM